MGEKERKKEGGREREKRACARSEGTWRRTDRDAECGIQSMVFVSWGPTLCSQFSPALDSRIRHHRCRGVALSVDKIFPR